MVNGEFGGRSLVDGQPIRSLVARQLPVTLLLAVYTVVLSVVVSVPLGVLAAWRWRRWPDYVVRLATIPGQAIPNFWVARDYPVIQSLATLLVFAMLSINLAIDLIYTTAAPRISYSTRSAP